MTPDDKAWDEFMRSERVSPQTYRRRRLVLLLIIAVIVTIGCFVHDGNIKNDPPPTSSPDIMETVP